MAGQDTRKLIPAGVTLPISGVNGDFIYLKFADRPVDIILGNSRVTMEAGDKYRPGQRFQGFELENPDPDNPAQVIFTIGEGDFNRQIIQGEIVSVPGIRNAAGRFVPDSRWPLSLDAYITSVTPEVFNQYDVIETFNVDSNDTLTNADAAYSFAYEQNQNVIFWSDHSGSGFTHEHYRYDRNTGQNEKLGSNPLKIGPDGNEDYQTKDFLGVFDENGDLWIGAYRIDDSSTALLKVDGNLNILAVKELPGTVGTGSTNASYRVIPVIANNQFYVVIPDGSFDVAIWDVAQNTKLGSITSNTGMWHGENGNLVNSDEGGGNTPQAVYTLPALESVATAGYVNLHRAGQLVPGKREYIYTVNISPDISIGTLFTYTVTARGVLETCASSLLVALNPNSTDAAITATENADGVEIRGQVIKALLDLWAGDFVTGNYMDFVYAVKFENANGRAPVTISGGGESLKGAKIDDNFVCQFPQKVTITLADGLKTEADA